MGKPHRMSEPYDFAIVGGGVIGLSIAWALAGTKKGKVVLLDRQKVGREASWAGAGILPPGSLTAAQHPIEKLAAASFLGHQEWAARLKVETGWDTGYRQCGALLVARTRGEAAALTGQLLEWQEHDVQAEELSAAAATQHLPALKPLETSILKAAWVPRESQIRNPDHLHALAMACRKSGVTVMEDVGDCQLSWHHRRVTGITTEQGLRVVANRVCLAAGVWTRSLAESIGVRISTIPVRGQMLLYKLPQRIFEPVLYEGTRYIVPRNDGHVVVGSTLEEAGFDKSTTSDGVAGLRQFAEGLIGQLNKGSLVRAWAGLRPAAFDGFPYIGPVPHLENLWIATAHFRGGLLLSTGTAEIMADLMCDREPPFDISPFRVDRG